MFDSCRLPPVYRMVPLAPGEDVAARGCAAAAAGAEAATLFCAERSDLLDCAVVLAPSTPLADAGLVIYVAALGLCDALGSTLPPGIDITFRWPNVIEANLGSAGRIDLRARPGALLGEVPPWLILRVITAISASASGRDRFETNLAAEGAVGLTVDELLSSFARHFLAWMNRWETDGFTPIRAMWLRHAPSRGAKIDVRVGGRKRRGIFADIDEDGALILDGRRGSSRIALSAVISV